ncbi:hypothetical protein L873DRAFT_1207508 [Choiromyces venosus 120613-1]|uniref:Uncharacterized protein n=1 Tax=Choiromyces venosus 120613-1 TaxID=1336337 RepID=A0A3N4JEJ7_9PEZI|nr:hypothetical protein L873DRAFT_1207508 [Choiromyces venosus 120613-1]
MIPTLVALPPRAPNCLPVHLPVYLPACCTSTLRYLPACLPIYSYIMHPSFQPSPLIHPPPPPSIHPPLPPYNPSTTSTHPLIHPSTASIPQFPLPSLHPPPLLFYPIAHPPPSLRHLPVLPPFFFFFFLPLLSFLFFSDPPPLSLLPSPLVNLDLTLPTLLITQYSISSFFFFCPSMMIITIFVQ